MYSLSEILPELQIGILREAKTRLEQTSSFPRESNTNPPASSEGKESRVGSWSWGGALEHWSVLSRILRIDIATGGIAQALSAKMLESESSLSMNIVDQESSSPSRTSLEYQSSDENIVDQESSLEARRSLEYQSSDENIDEAASEYRLVLSRKSSAITMTAINAKARNMNCIENGDTKQPIYRLLDSKLCWKLNAKYETRKESFGKLGEYVFICTRDTSTKATQDRRRARDCSFIRGFTINPLWSRRKLFFLPIILSTTASVTKAALRSEPQWRPRAQSCFDDRFSRKSEFSQLGFLSVENGRDWFDSSYLLADPEMRKEYTSFKLSVPPCEKCMMCW